MSSLRTLLASVLPSTIALTALGCAATPPRPAPSSTATAWTLTMLGGECTLSGRDALATTASCAALGTVALGDDPAAARLGAMVAALAPADTADALGRAGGRLSRGDAAAAPVDDGWIPIAREVKRVLRAHPATAASTAPLGRWQVTAASCTLVGDGAQLLTHDCAGLAPTTPIELSAWLATAAIDRTATAPTACALVTELAEPYPLDRDRCAALAGLLDAARTGATAPRHPANKLDAAASIALAQLAPGDDPVVEASIEWTADPADRDRLLALGATFSTTALTSIQGVRVRLRALPAVAALASVARVELAQPLVIDG